MGDVISSILGVVGMITAGVMTSMAASKADDCKDTKKMCIAIAMAEFTLAIVMMFILIFLM